MIIVRESWKESLINDLITFGMICLTFWINYKFIGGNDSIDFFLLLAIICWGCPTQHKVYSVSEEKLQKIEEILKQKV